MRIMFTQKDKRDIPLDEIRVEMIKHNAVDDFDDLRRTMTINFIINNYGFIGTVFFTINGTPPRGYAIYHIELEKISYYDIRGERWKEERFISVPEIQKLIENRKFNVEQFVFGGDSEICTNEIEECVLFDNLEFL